MKVRQSLRVVQFAILAMSLMYLCSCSSDVVRNDMEYIEEIEQWRQNRLQRLRGPVSWVSLIGRHPMKEGANSVGTKDTNDIRLPGDNARDFCTVFIDSNEVLVIPAAETQLLLDNGNSFSGGVIDMRDPPYLHVDALYWTFLERAGTYYFRVWDTLNPARSELTELPAYPVDPKWRIEATFSPADSGAVIVLDDIQGEKRPNDIIGYVSGLWHDTMFTLLALDGGPEELFIIIEDATTDIETYPGGRYMYIPRADSTGRTEIDFNKAYTPPCAFTEFATCLLPPEENRLPFAVRAGERVLH